MVNRQALIAESIVEAIVDKQSKPELSASQKKTSLFRRLYLSFLAFLQFFTIWRLPLRKIKEAVFRELREGWGVGENDYLRSFGGQQTRSRCGSGGHLNTEDENGTGTALITMGDMGYSGSSFFVTSDAHYLIKSVPRKFEHSFFRDDLLDPYVSHLSSNPSSLLVRICDFLECSRVTIGGSLGYAPTHHIIMENVLYGQEEASKKGGKKWESFDLKPTSYFFPERDIAGGALASEATKSRLADEFDGKVVLTSKQKDDFLGQLARDTELLEQCNAVDYSLMLVGIKTERKKQQQQSEEDPFRDPDPSQQPTVDKSLVPQEPPFAPPDPPSWRTGVVSSDGRYYFRAVILDFFWAKHKLQPRVMTGLIKIWNLVNRQGPMSITTTSKEYRERFLRMCEELIEVDDSRVDDGEHRG